MGYSSTGKLADFGRTEPMVAAVKRTVSRVGQDLLERTKEHTPVAKPPPGAAAEWLAARKRAPGTLKESWKCGEVTISEDGKTYTIDVYTNDSIAPYVEWPTMPHIIVPRNGGMLRFWNALGQTVYATVVHHTGTRGSYMLTTAIAEEAVAWQQIGDEEMEQWSIDQAALVRA